MDKKEIEEYILNNQKFIHYCLNKYIGKRFIIDGYTQDDYFQVACVILMERLGDFDPSKSSINTFVSNTLNLYLYNLSVKQNKLCRNYAIQSTNFKINGKKDNVIEIEDYLLNEEDKTDDIIYNIIEEKVLSELTDKRRYLYRYIKVYGSYKSSKMFNISQSYCSRIKNFVNFNILKEYGYEIYYEDLKLLDDNIKLSKANQRYLNDFKKLHNENSNESLMVCMSNLGIYKELLKRKYNK